MEQKGLIKWVLIALLIVCVFQLVFHLPTLKVERNADTYAQEASSAISDPVAKYNVEKTARIRYLDSMSGKEIFSLPLLKKYTYSDLKKQQLALGLDLKGGMSSIIQIDLRDFLVSLSNNNSDPLFKSALDNADKALANSQADYITLFAQEYKKVAPNQKLAALFSRSSTLKDQMNFETSDGDVQRIIRKLADETVDLTFNRIKDRIDKFGAVQPNISLDKKRDMILVELPGVDNPERARKYLQASAKLEFFEVYRLSDPGVYDALLSADKKLKAMMSGDTSAVVNTPKYTLQNRYEFSRDSLGNITDSTLVGV
ncbi:MAG: protein translocase subunit SecDF, partial [Saprospiraceae bacterium]